MSARRWLTLRYSFTSMTLPCLNFAFSAYNIFFHKHLHTYFDYIFVEGWTIMLYSSAFKFVRKDQLRPKIALNLHCIHTQYI